MTTTNDEPEEVTVVLPDAPKCKKCGHMMCPCCRTWCDVLDGPDNDLCCEGQCEVDADEFAAWEEKMNAIEIPEFARLVYESDQKAIEAMGGEEAALKAAIKADEKKDKKEKRHAKKAGTL